MELIEVYNRILEAANLDVEDGVVSVNIGDGGSVIHQPVTIGGKTLHMPTDDFLKNPDWENFVAFHPLSENPMRGESEVLKLVRAYMVADLNAALMALMEGLIRIAANTDGHKRLSATASECLDAVPKADTKSVKDLHKVLEQMDDISVTAIGEILDRLDNTNRRKLVNFYLKRAGTYKGKEYGRVCVVDFPFLAEEALDDDKRSIFGVKLRVKDYEGFRKLFSFIVDTEEANSERYNSGTNGMTAPYLTVLLQSWFKLAKRLNRLIKLYSKHVPELEAFERDVSWEPVLEDFADLARQVPPLEGNRGSVPVGDEVKEEPKKRSTNKLVPKFTEVKPEEPVQPSAPHPAQVPMSAPNQPQHQQPPVYAPAPTQSSTGPTWAELQRQRQQQQPQPVYQQPQPVYQQPQPGYYPPQYQQPQQGYYPPQPQVQTGWASEALGTQPQQPYQQPYQQPSTGSPLRDAARQQQPIYYNQNPPFSGRGL